MDTIMYNCHAHIVSSDIYLVGDIVSLSIVSSCSTSLYVVSQALDMFMLCISSSTVVDHFAMCIPWTRSGSAVECPTLERGNTVTNPPTAYTLAPLMATRCGVVTP